MRVGCILSLVPNVAKAVKTASAFYPSQDDHLRDAPRRAA
jgi:hypothetical protein